MNDEIRFIAIICWILGIIIGWALHRLYAKWKSMKKCKGEFIGIIARRQDLKDPKNH